MLPITIGRRVWVMACISALSVACGPTLRRIEFGEACDPSDTTAVCSIGPCVALDSATGICTETCVDDSACPTGSFCLPAGRYGNVCLPVLGCKADVDCPAGHTCNTDTGSCFINVTRGLCSPCQDSKQCPTGGTCFTAVGSRERFCTSACGANDVCPTGFTCRPVPVGGAGMEIKQCVPANETCNAGRGLCAACSGDQECGGPADLCVRNVVSNERFCARDCNPSRNRCKEPGCDPLQLSSAENPDCPTGFACTVVGQGDDVNRTAIHQCVPVSNTCQGFCDASDDVGQVSQCGLGKLCTGGACQPATDGRMCSPCSTNDDCRRGGFSENRCIVNNCPNCPFRGESFCAPACTNDEVCSRAFGPGFLCKAVVDQDGSSRKFCMPQRGTCQSGLGRLGDDCSSRGAQDCVAGTCIGAGVSQFCSVACTADSQCGDTRYRCCEVVNGQYDCAPSRRTPTGPASGSGVCAPITGLFGDDCSPGQPPCQTGTCLDLGTARLCSVLCNAGACPDGFSCRKATMGTEADATTLDVCFPNGGGTAGADCSFGPAACQTGLCIRRQSGPICTQTCLVDQDCPEAWQCSPLQTVTNQSVQACLPPELQP